jgi:hypothetical protein
MDLISTDRKAGENNCCKALNAASNIRKGSSPETTPRPSARAWRRG